MQNEITDPLTLYYCILKYMNCIQAYYGRLARNNAALSVCPSGGTITFERLDFWHPFVLCFADYRCSIEIPALEGQKLPNESYAMLMSTLLLVVTPTVTYDLLNVTYAKIKLLHVDSWEDCQAHEIYS